MHDASPQISIVLPFRDAARTLPECLDSIARQTWPGYEVIAIDDGSADDGAALLRARAATDARIRLVSSERAGLVAALNRGIAEARAPLIARMDADDLMYSERLEAQRTFLLDHPNIALVATQVELFPADLVRDGYREYVRWQNGVLTPDEVATNIYVESPFAHPSVMLRREVFAQLGGYADGPFPEDYELWLRMHRAGLRMAKIPRVLLGWRESSNRASRTDSRYARAAFDELRARFLAADPRLQTDRAIVVWGAGRTTRQRVKPLLARGIAPSAWIDIDPDKIGHRVWGLPVHPKAWLDQPLRPFVLVYVASHGAREQIAVWLAEMGYRIGDDYLMIG